MNNLCDRHRQQPAPTTWLSLREITNSEQTNSNNVPKATSYITLTSKRDRIIALFSTTVTRQKSSGTWSAVAKMQMVIFVTDGHIERNICDILYLLHQYFSRFCSGFPPRGHLTYSGCNIWNGTVRLCILLTLRRHPVRSRRRLKIQFFGSFSTEPRCVNLQQPTTVKKTYNILKQPASHNCLNATN
jgi:hypothetical protein